MQPWIKYIRPNNVLVVACGLLAKWLRVRIRVRIRAAARECTRFLFSFFSCLISVVNTFVFGISVSARLITYEYLINDVIATCIVVNLATPLHTRPCMQHDGRLKELIG